ncbi:type II toxin-antitoxin system RelE/ParE family toxin [Bosea caraganae]|uniref:Type II toxin-antitoxin system RelE/ParE family toxin n=1 Tax=Bosea caraganae TaxID=2763117 RepID=A0A370L648_9HYPH|nr:type II toxin-antitoxin system RelE/ParE family toxin [Bosea caraganae]RDJ23291.1 type II toxin-antitoxin system RelE/ParE family toxin [Bosea caraganae]RDJ24596.1 type II toxin-antitoxin system RelE/ParE family toxin [Bosea caraganae]
MPKAALSVILLEEAVSDLSEIYDYIYGASVDPLTAERFVTRIFDFCGKIGMMPRGGRPRDDLSPGLRTFPFERRTVIAYRIVGDTVEITNIFYGGRDYEALYRDAPGKAE